MAKDFGKRLERDVKKIVKQRADVNAAKMAHLSGAQQVAAKAPEVHVVAHDMQV